MLRLPADYRANIFIGISSTIESKGTFSWTTGCFGKGHHYVIHDNGFKYMQDLKNWIPYCKKIKVEDEIRIDLNLKRAEMKYFVNGEDQGIAYKNVMKGWDINYRLMIGMDTGEVIKLPILSFFEFV